MTAKAKTKTLRITQTKSAIGCPSDQRATLRALGLRGPNQTVDQADSPSVRGMVFKVKHLVLVDEQAE